MQYFIIYMQSACLNQNESCRPACPPRRSHPQTKKGTPNEVPLSIACPWAQARLFQQLANRGHERDAGNGGAHQPDDDLGKHG